MRLDKYLAFCGFGSRKEVKRLIKDKRVMVNQSTVQKEGFLLQEGQDSVSVDGNMVCYERNVYLMLNKPAGYLSANEDPRHPTVFDLVTEYAHRDLFCVGRLDMDTEGLLLLCDDGDLAHRLLSPKHHVAKRYEVGLAHALSDDDIKRLEQGIVLADGFQCMPANVIQTTNHTLVLEIFEGKFHQVKRMLLAVDNEVQHLRRIQMGSLHLDASLPLGEYRKLTDEEILQLHQ